MIGPASCRERARRGFLQGRSTRDRGDLTAMTSKQAPRRISTIRYCAPAPRTGGGRNQASPLVGAAMITAIALAIALLALTMNAAQAMQ
jgi:multisubunit Na+/H+ antiporter MnhC subunit